LASQNRIKDAVIALRCAVTLYPLSQWFSNASVLLLDRSTEDALIFASEGVERFPTDATLLFNQGNAFSALQRFEEAENAFLKVVEIDPAMVDARVNLGNCYRKSGRSAQAMPHYDHALAIDPQHKLATLGKGVALVDLGRLEDAEPYLSMVADVPEAAFMLALLRLEQGDYRNGWQLYKSRIDCAFAKSEKAKMLRPQLPDLASAAGKHILLVHEQGFGDTLQFVRFAPMMLQHAAKVSVLVPVPLLRLVREIDSRLNVVIDRSSVGTYDYEVLMMDQPGLLGIEVDAIPAQPYIKVPAKLLRRKALPPASGPKIGLCWAGQKRIESAELMAVNARRSMALDTFKPLSFMWELPGVNIYSLQLGEPANEIGYSWVNDRDGNFHFHEPLDYSFDFLDTAAIISQLDVVVTVDTAVAHLAAGLGVPTFILSRHDGCWRWLRDRDDSPWYNSVKLFRQAVPGEWDETVARVVSSLIAKFS
jgi:tetratricopeptide (TPR) repeat protein